jgi:HK97 family phage major capsid protein
MAKQKAISLGDQMDAVRRGFRQAYPLGSAELVSSNDTWVAEIYDDHVIVEQGGEYYTVSYSKQDDEFFFAPRDQWAAVEREVAWVAKSIQAQVLESGRNPIKSLAKTDSELRVGNYMILFGDEKHKDLEGEWFTPETEVESDYTRTGTLYEDFEHGLGKAIDGVGPDQEDILGRVDWATMKADNLGIWVERVLNRRNKYVQFLEPLIDAGLMGSSSQAVPGKIEKKSNGEIVKWPLRRDSMTVMPAEPRMMTENVVGALKSLAKSLRQQPEASPEDAGEPASSASAAPTPAALPSKSISIKEKTMTREELLAQFAGVMGVEADTLSEPQKALAFRGTEFETPTEPSLSSLEERMNKFSEQMQELLRYAEGSPAINKAGYISQDGGAADPDNKSFGDFLVAVARNDSKRLNKIYGSFKAIDPEGKAMGEGSGTAGGYMVPTEYENTLLKISNEASRLRNMVTVVPVNSPRGEWPALNQFTAPTAGQGDSAYAGGMVARRTAENAELSETEASLEQIKWNVEKVGGWTEASNELINDSPMAVETMLTALFALAIDARREYYIFRGTGAGEPLGILNAAAAVGVSPTTNSTFALADALNMVSRFKTYLTMGDWFIHPGIIPDLDFLTNTTYVVNADASARNVIGLPLLGKQVHQSEHLPQDDNSGCVVLADMKAYLLFERRGLEIAFSEHAAFKQDKGVWRFYQRLDGQPWLPGPITLADPQGSYTVTPFVYFND